MVSRRRNDIVLVTGGGGFVGYHVICELHRRGYAVAVIDTVENRRGRIDAAYYPVDLRNAKLVKEVIENINPHLAIHLAAVHYIPYCNEHPRETFAVNVVGTRNLLDALEWIVDINRIFLASSAGVYSFSEMPHAEGDPAWPVDIYGFTKRAMEMLALEWSDRVGIPITLGRYFNMYGWGETTPHLIPTLIKQIRDGATSVHLGNVHTRRDFIHVSDNARATVDLLEMETRENVIVNLGSGTAYSAANIVSMLAAIVGRDLEVITDTSRVRDNDRPNLVADMTRFFELRLPYPIISLVRGLADLMETGVGPYLCELE